MTPDFLRGWFSELDWTAAQPGRVEGRILGRLDLPRRRLRRPQGGHNRTHDAQRVRVIIGEMIDDTGDAGVQRPAAQVLCGHHLPGS